MDITIEWNCARIRPGCSDGHTGGGACAHAAAITLAAPAALAAALLRLWCVHAYCV